MDFADPRTVAEVVAAARDSAAAAGDTEAMAAYLALPAGVFLAAVTALGVIGLPAGSRIALKSRSVMT